VRIASDSYPIRYIFKSKNRFTALSKSLGNECLVVIRSSPFRESWWQTEQSPLAKWSRISRIWLSRFPLGRCIKAMSGSRAVQIYLGVISSRRASPYGLAAGTT
jgi:hypothetical protein